MPQNTNKPAEQSTLRWLLGYKETESERAAREQREAEQKRKAQMTQESINKAITGAQQLRKVVQDSKAKNKATGSGK